MYLFVPRTSFLIFRPPPPHDKSSDRDFEPVERDKTGIACILHPSVNHGLCGTLESGGSMMHISLGAWGVFPTQGDSQAYLYLFLFSHFPDCTGGLLHSLFLIRDALSL